MRGTGGRSYKKNGGKRRKKNKLRRWDERDSWRKTERKDRKKACKITPGYSCSKISLVCGRLSLKLLSALFRFSINSLALVDISARSSSNT